MGVSVCQFNIV